MDLSLGSALADKLSEIETQTGQPKEYFIGAAVVLVSLLTFLRDEDQVETLQDVLTTLLAFEPSEGDERFYCSPKSSRPWVGAGLHLFWLEFCQAALVRH